MKTIQPTDKAPSKLTTAFIVCFFAAFLYGASRIAESDASRHDYYSTLLAQMDSAASSPTEIVTAARESLRRAQQKNAEARTARLGRARQRELDAERAALRLRERQLEALELWLSLPNPH